MVPVLLVLFPLLLMYNTRIAFVTLAVAIALAYRSRVKN